MEKKALVSLITPCHNSAAFIHRLFDSVLNQTYPNIEMIAVDNDSKDNTAKIIKNYIPLFNKKGYRLIYLHEEDLGPSAAIQNGLKHINGEYLLMPDSDDWYSMPTSIEKFVTKFEELPDVYAILRSQIQFIDEKSMLPIKIAYKDFPTDDPGTLFEDCLFAKNGYNFAPIGYMVKVSKLREQTGLQIFNAYNMGQQRQICLPLYYNYKAWTIPEPLVNYLVRSNSISHGSYNKYETQKELHEKIYSYISTILNSITNMTIKEKEMYLDKYMRQSIKRIAYQACNNNDKKGLRAFVNEYKTYGGNRFLLIILLKIQQLKALRKKVSVPK